ncbi:SUMF1/EgtB/PvdO family nonheme iron enzyme [Algoriphagus sp.]|uniref:formylglycine-generating enzyme family protein n=1 Tax=Algoriphagus sp. TaxID=1872435 RepID=UPI0026308491|nr:SUMF1/EgtB/PvdO family nonheme iron enzyme [Algoriphagus sp.]
MIKKTVFLLFFTLAARYWEDSNFEPYTQQIPGTEVQFDLVPIPEGSFLMGSDESPFEDEKPTHAVKIDAFWMGTHEITWDIFELFLDKNYELALTEEPISELVDGLTRPSIPYLDMTFGMGKEAKPAVGMTQYGAIQFCHWLYLKTGIFYRLPTEAEWEYAAKAGSETQYFYGDDPELLGEYAWTAENSPESTQKVGQKKPNPWGLYDIYGNVMEWTSDQYDPNFYQNSPKENPANPAEKLYPRVIRGGSFKHNSEEISSTKRYVSDPKWKQIDPQIPKSQWWFPEAPFLGLRVVRPLIPPSPEEIQAYYTQAPISDY